jgi:hypothetical protein
VSAEPLLFAVGAVHERVALPVVDVDPLEGLDEVEELEVDEVEAAVLVALALDAAASDVASVPDPPQPERHSKTAAMPQAAFTDFMNGSSLQWY